MKTFLIAILGVLLFAGCGREASPPPQDIRPVRAEQVGVHAAASDTRYAGEVRARYETALAFRVAGRVQTRAVDVGSQVKAGQAIATLHPQDYALAVGEARAQLTAAEAEAKLAQQDLQRFSELRAQNFISQAELDRRRTTAEAAQARVRQLRAEAARQGNQQAYTHLTAPHAGVVTAITFEAGQVVAAGQPVAQLARNGEREVRIDVPENALDALRAAQTLTIRLWSAPDKACTVNRKRCPLGTPLRVVAAGEAEVGVALAEAVTAGDALEPAAAAEHREAVRRRLYEAPLAG